MEDGLINGFTRISQNHTISENFEDAIRKAIWLGGDSDTLACITGGIAEAYYKEMPDVWIEKSRSILDDKLNQLVDRFQETFK